MISILIGFVCLIIAFFVVVIIKSSPNNPARFANMIAKQQRLALNTIRKAEPGLSIEQGYIKAMATRTPHREDELRRMLGQTKKEAKESGEPLRFNELIYRLAVAEYTMRVTAEKRRPEMYPEMKKAIKAVIADDL
jgi:hypothetical protein